MEIFDGFSDNWYLTIFLVALAVGGLVVHWAIFQYLRARGDGRARRPAELRLAVVGSVVFFVVLGGFIPWLFDQFGDSEYRRYSGYVLCDDHLKTVLNPRTGSFGSSVNRVNEAILEIQTRYPEECHYTNWNVAAANYPRFGDGPRENQCFSPSPGSWPEVGASSSRPGEPLYVGRVTVPEYFYDSHLGPDGPVLVPRGASGRDAHGNVLVIFDAWHDYLPLDGSDCWLFRAGRLNQWFSSRDQ